MKKHMHITPAEFYEQHQDKILNCFKPQKISSTNYLLRVGDLCNKLYYVRSGLISTFFIDNDGFEKTSSVITEGTFGTEWRSFISQEVSSQFIEANEKCELHSINYNDFFRLVDEDGFWKDFYAKCLESAYINQFRKVSALMTLDARQRYQKLLNGNPGLIQKLSNKTLGSFLDMREETLSRIKSKK